MIYGTSENQSRYIDLAAKLIYAGVINNNPHSHIENIQLQAEHFIKEIPQLNRAFQLQEQWNAFQQASISDEKEILAQYQIYKILKTGFSQVGLHIQPKAILPQLIETFNQMLYDAHGHLANDSQIHLKLVEIMDADDLNLFRVHFEIMDAEEGHTNVLYPHVYEKLQKHNYCIATNENDEKRIKDYLTNYKN